MTSGRTDFLHVWRSFGCTLGLVCTASFAFYLILFWGCLFCLCLCLFEAVVGISFSFFIVLMQNFHHDRDILLYSNIVHSLSLYCVCS